MAIKAKQEAELSVIKIETGLAEVCILGTSPLYFNRLAEKARRELLAPKGRRVSSADRAGSPKHDPVKEFHDSVHRNPDGSATRLYLPSPAFKGAMMTAALDLPGTKKAEIGRLLWVESYSVDVYGIPFLKMDGVRTADINRTPDIRTRAYLPEWACKIRVKFVKPKLNTNAVYNLLVAGGITCGVGDFRQEKGKGNFGQFTVVDPDNTDFKRILKTQALKQQDHALAAAQPYPGDPDTMELFDWFQSTMKTQ